MYYAVDRCDLREAERAFRTCFDHGPADAHWFALVDLAFVTESPSALRSFAQFEPASLFIERPLDKLADASPVLMTLDHEPGARIEQTSKLLRLAQDMPMLSFICTTRSREEQIAAWQPYVYPRFVDEQRLVLRFADTRVAAGLSTALSNGHWSGLTAGLQRWLIVGRVGALVSLIGEPTAPPPSETREPICLSVEELSALMECGEPDAVIGYLHKHCPELLPHIGRARLHAQIAKACGLARTAGIRSFKDVTCLSQAVVLTDGAVLMDPRLKPLLAEQRISGQLNDTLLELLSNG